MNLSNDYFVVLEFFYKNPVSLTTDTKALALAKKKKIPSGRFQQIAEELTTMGLLQIGALYKDGRISVQNVTSGPGPYLVTNLGSFVVQNRCKDIRNFVVPYIITTAIAAATAFGTIVSAFR